MTASRDRWSRSLFSLRLVLGVSLLAVLGLTAVLAQAPAQPPDKAGMLLDSAKRAYNEKNFPFAVTKFREYLQQFGGNKQANDARYGLALSLVEGPDRDYNAALEQLNELIKNKDFPDHPYAIYYTGLSYRGLGVKALALADAKPAEAKQHQDNARNRFEEAAKHFAAAITAFTARAKEPDPAAKELPKELEWAARARCDLAEMQLRTLKAKEAQATAAPFAVDKSLARSRYQKLGLYYHGFASFLLKDNLAAGRSLSLLTPFQDPVYGTHARFLLARVHHHDNERQEAIGHYEGVLDDYAKNKTAAIEDLKQPDRFKNDPDEKGRLEQLARGPAPDHVARASFFLGVMLYEDGKFADALTRFVNFQQQLPNSPLLNEAKLRQGFCQVQLKQFAEAQKTLQPLVDKEARLADQALLWIGKAQVGAADPNKPPEYEQGIKAAVETLRKAGDRANQLVQTDPGAKVRRGEILAELADAQQLIKQYREAANTYNTVLNEKLLPARDEELTLSLATALHLANDYNESDKVCDRFRTTYPKSVLLPSVLFRYAENAYFVSLLAEKAAKPEDRAKEVARTTEEVLKRYQVVVEKYPEYPQINLARYGLAMAYYRKGDLEKAREKLETIPPGDRNGELAVVPYQLADCLLKLAPAKTDDAISAARLEETLKVAVEQLESYIGANPNGPQTPDALIKLGHCLQRQAGLLGQPPEKAKAYAAARAAYEQLNQRFPKSEQASQAIFERARVIGLSGDVNGAINELRRFTNDPLKTANIAPMALLHLATLLRGQNKAAEAADVLSKCRQAHEANLTKDPARSGWVPLLLYHEGVALREAGKRPEARAVLELVVKQSPDRPEAAEAALRSGQCMKDDAELKIADAQKKLANPGLKPEELVLANKLFEDGVKELKDATAYMVGQADRLKEKQPNSEARARMMYEAAWGYRRQADMEISAAEKKIAQEQWQKRRDDLAKKLPPGHVLPNMSLPVVPLTAIPVQPAETSARNQYQAMIQAFPDLATNADARFELAEMMSERGEHDNAIKLLREALDKEPNPDLTDKVRVRLGVSLQSKGDTKGALAQFQLVLQNPKSGQLGNALYRSSECLLQMADYAEAAKRLARFRDEGPLQNLPGLSDRAMLRLGHALDKLKQWEPSRAAHEQVIGRFPNSPWVAEARYGMGWALQNLQRFDDAVNAYTQVTAMTATELGARAQMNIGICRLAQKRYNDAATALLVVPFTYDYPHLSAISLVEAARAFSENKQPEQAIKLLERVLRDHPDTEPSEAARKRLEELRKG
jgi:cellulose synthase operon protein C